MRKEHFLELDVRMDGVESKSVIHKQLVSGAPCCWVEGGNHLAAGAKIIS